MKTMASGMSGTTTTSWTLWITAKWKERCHEPPYHHPARRPDLRVPAPVGLPAEHIPESSSAPDHPPHPSPRRAPGIERGNREGRGIVKLAWHVHHDILVERLTEPLENRIAYIKQRKPADEQELRLRFLQPVR